MKLKVNGDDHEHRGDGTLASLLKEIHANIEMVTVMVNDDIILRAACNSTNLTEGDTIEILTFVGGGALGNG